MTHLLVDLAPILISLKHLLLFGNVNTKLNVSKLKETHFLEYAFS